MFKPGPFYMGDGWLGKAANTICITWTLFVCIIFSMPTVLPVNAANMNYASLMAGGVVLLSLVWYFIGWVVLGFSLSLFSHNFVLLNVALRMLLPSFFD
jgi:hypothetical protein